MAVWRIVRQDSELNFSRSATMLYRILRKVLNDAKPLTIVDIKMRVLLVKINFDGPPQTLDKKISEYILPILKLDIQTQIKKKLVR